MHSRCSSTLPSEYETPQARPISHVPIHRVASAAKRTGVSVDLHPIETALQELLNTSLALDHKKKLALQDLQRSRPIHIRLYAGILNKRNSFINHLFGGTSVPDTLG